MQLDRLRLPAPVSAVHVKAAATAPLEPQQQTFWVAGGSARPPARLLAGLIDRLGNRLAISILVAALIIGLALVVFAGGGGSWLAPAGFVAVVLLGLWLVISIWRSGRF